MSVKRWVLTDPTDPVTATNHYLFPMNPASMTGVYPERAVTAMTSTAGNILLHEGVTPPKQWTFSGPLFDKSHFTNLHTWVYLKKGRVILTDHFGRNITLVFTGLDVVPKRRMNIYWSHDYTATALIVSIKGLSVGPMGPV